MALRRSLLVGAMVLVWQPGWTQSPTYGLGKTPTAEEVGAWDISISPTGKELPQGQGTAKEGAELFVRKGCAGCHGATGAGTHAPVLVSRKDHKRAPSEFCLAPCVNDSNAMAIHAPFATVMWDYIHRGMPLGSEGSLKPDEVYALTAYLLFKNGVIKEDEIMNERTLPQVKMPNRDGSALPPEWKHGMPRLQGYP